MSILQLIRPSDVRTVAGGAGIEGRVGVFYQDETTGQLYVWSPSSLTMEAVPLFDANGSLRGVQGGVSALATAAQAGTALTATGVGYTGACEFWGIEVTAYNGGPQTIVVRDGGAGGSIVATFTVSGLGFYGYSGDWTTPGGGQNLSRAMSTDVHLTISGGTSRTVAAIVTPI